MEGGSGLELAEDFAALRARFEGRIRHLLDDLEAVTAGVALIFAEGHGLARLRLRPP
jgi:hypothetical protein